MSISALRSRKGKELTKQMLIDKLDEVASLATAMETVLVEWETWWRIIPTIEKGMTAEEFAFYVKENICRQ
jgi:hypothetical protein